MEDQRQAKIYNQIWDKIKKPINNVDGVNFRFSDYFKDRGFKRFDTAIRCYGKCLFYDNHY